MRHMWRMAGAMALALGLSACEPIDIDGGGGGGGGDVLFTRGFVFVREDRNLYVVDDQGDPNSPQRLTTGGGVAFPSVSRNGRSVVFVQQGAGSTFEIRTVPTNGSAAPSTVFVSGGTECSRCTNFRTPTFSPDGNVIVFAFNRGTGAYSLGRVNASGSGFQELTPGATLTYGAPSFFPDGQSVLAPAGNSLTQLSQLARVGLNGTTNSITNNFGSEVLRIANRAVVSPDGTQVALDGIISTGSARIFVGPLSPTFGPLVRITDHPGEVGAQDTFPSWMSGTQVGFLSDAGNTQSIYRIGTNTTPGPGTLLIPTAIEPAYGGP